MRGRPKIIFTGSIAALGLSLLLVREPFLSAIGNFLVVQDKLEPADLIHVISGLDHRPNYGIQLYKQGYGKWIFFTGGWCPYHQVNHACHSRELAIEQGVPDRVIVTDEADINSTYAEAARLKEWIDHCPEPIRSVIVVSDPHHMRRSRWTYRRILGSGIRLIMVPVPFESSPYKRQWWIDTRSRRMVKDEYLKFGYYVARYQLSWGPFKEWLSTLDTE